jgi:hypothetical protein
MRLGACVGACVGSAVCVRWLSRGDASVAHPGRISSMGGQSITKIFGLPNDNNAKKKKMLECYNKKKRCYSKIKIAFQKRSGNAPNAI